MLIGHKQTPIDEINSLSGPISGEVKALICCYHWNCITLSLFRICHRWCTAVLVFSKFRGIRTDCDDHLSAPLQWQLASSHSMDRPLWTDGYQCYNRFYKQQRYFIYCNTRILSICSILH